MVLFKVTIQKLLLHGDNRLEAAAGMTADVLFNGSNLPFSNSTIISEFQRQFKLKYKKMIFIHPDLSPRYKIIGMVKILDLFLWK